ncbi:MAG: BREX-1 system adenine-specific DNA-methyltransferase PglX [Eubacteriaceae bacterium]
MNKTAIKNFAVWARQKLISEIIYKAELMGISEKGISAPLPNSTDTLEFYDSGTDKPTELSGMEVKQRKSLVQKIKDKEEELCGKTASPSTRNSPHYKTAFGFVVEEVAYTWFNRLVAIRFMEVNDYLPSGVRVLSSERSGKAEPDMVTTPFETDLTFNATETDKIIELKDENKLDELFRMLFIKECNKLNEVLPNLFERTSDYTELLLTLSFTDNDGILSHLVNDIAEDDLKEAVEIIGWLYQYYNTEPKDAVFARLKKNIKITKDHIPAATQLFTPDWIVRYMVENSLGRIFVEGEVWKVEREEKRQGEEKAIAQKMGWKYYLPEAEQLPEVRKELNSIHSPLHSEFNVESIKLIDPCMGSGHILVYTFDVLLQIYESQGYTQRDAASAIIQNNIYGLDIDERAYQLAYFALMMKARQYDRRFFTRGISPQVYCPKGYADGEEFGSLINVDALEAKPQAPEELTFFKMDWEKDLNTWNFRRLLAQKYDVVITNPPYKATSDLNPKLSEFVKKNFPDSKSDLFAVFIEKGNKLVDNNGYNCMVTMQSWMFLSSFEKMREKLLKTTDISNLMHMENMVMGIAFGTAVANFRRSKIKGYKGTYNLISMKDLDEDGLPIEFPIKSNRFSQVSTENFSKIPDSPIAYWASEKIILAFINNSLYERSKSPSQNVTGNNSKYVLKHWELNKNKIGCKDAWIFYAKGGGFRKWWGNLLDVVNWTPKARIIYQFGDGNHASQIINKEFWYKKGITWGLITSALPSFRIMPEGATYDKGGSTIIVDEPIFNFSLGLLNSKVYLEISSMLNPTLNFQVKDVRSIPIILSQEKAVNSLVEQNIALSKSDWDSFETSWDFVRHPLIDANLPTSVKLYDTAERQRLTREGKEIPNWTIHPKYGVEYFEGQGTAATKIKHAFERWTNYTIQQFSTLKKNEEKLNCIFIEIYGLEDELTPEVEDKDVTVRKADLSRDIKSLVSYAVGCMFGRYSLDVDGLAYAGGNWDDSKYKSFIPDLDNCIPITDEEYFSDDIAGLLAEFTSTVYGAETLEENLDFIAKALGNKGSTSREIIRNYFLKDFYKDHVKMYKKRPIYWLYDSGKENGFKALIYMHRYTADTTGKVRVEYLHKMQKAYTREIERMQDEIDNGKTAVDTAKAEKRKEKLIKQLKETKEYDEKIAHLALSRIIIDLDDGVKVNYEKVQTGQDGKKLEILGKI